MINFDDVTKENMKEDNPNRTKIPDHPYIILTTGGSRSGITKSLFNLISQETDIDQIYLYSEDPYEAKDKFLSKKDKLQV